MQITYTSQKDFEKEQIYKIYAIWFQDLHREFSAVQGLGLWAFTTEGTDLILYQEVDPQAVQYDPK